MDELKKVVLEKMQSFSEPGLKEEMVRYGKVLTAGKGDVLIKEGQRLDFLPIVISGSIRVYRQWEGREILLYYVKPQETCMMSLSSAYFSNISAANGMAMEKTEIMVLPAKMISEWQLKYPSWNQFIISTFRSRYDELLNAFENVAFNPISGRVKDYLIHRSSGADSKRVDVSHQTLANELGTTRVVISRILKQLEKDGFIQQFRGYVLLK